MRVMQGGRDDEGWGQLAHTYALMAISSECGGHQGAGPALHNASDSSPEQGHLHGFCWQLSPQKLTQTSAEGSQT